MTTTPGSLYALSFWYAGHPACVMTNGTGTASAMAAAGDASMTVTSGPTNNYTRVALAFTATRETTAISFRSLTSFGCGGVLIDNVSVDPMTRDACVREGWQSFGVFKNQGDCVSFVATRGANRPGGA